LRELARYQVSYDLLVHPRHLKHVKTVAENCPELRLVVDHMAKPPIAKGEMYEWKQAIKEIAAYPNIYCKLSGLVTEANWEEWRAEDLQPYVDYALEIFGPPRLMFGSDYPVCLLAATYDQVLESFKLLTIGLSDEDKSHIFGGNAAEFYRLSEGAKYA
jgi:L-fuconolactonase